MARASPLLPGALRHWAALVAWCSIAGCRAAPSRPDAVAPGGDPPPELVLQAGHSQYASAVAFSPDGRLLASGSADHSIRIWEVATGRLLRNLTGSRNAIEHLAWSPDGKRLAYGTTGVVAEVGIWDVASGDGWRRSEDKAAAMGIRLLTFDSSGAGLLYASDLSMRLLDLGDSTEVELGAPNKWELERWGFVALSADRRRVAVVPTRSRTRSDGQIQVFPFEPGTPGVSISTPPLGSVALSPDGSLLATGTLDGSVRVTNVATGHEVVRLPADGPVAALAFSPDGRELAVGVDRLVSLRVGGASLGVPGTNPGGGAVWIWPLSEPSAGPRVLPSLLPPGRLAGVASIAYSPDGRWIAAGVGDQVRVWAVESGESRPLVADLVSLPVRDVAFSPDRRRLVSADQGAVSWEVGAGVLSPDMLGRRVGENLAFSPDGGLLAWSDYRSVFLTDLSTGEMRRLGDHQDLVGAVAFSPDAAALASGGVDGAVYLWDLRANRATRRVGRPGKAVESLRWSPDGRSLAVASADFLTVWDAASGAERAATAFQGASTVALSPDWRSHAWAWSGMLSLRDSATQVVRDIRLPGDGAGSLVFSPDGQSIAARLLVGMGSSARIWATATGAERYTLAGHGTYIHDLDFSPNGRHIATASADGTTRLWDAASGEHLASLVVLRRYEAGANPLAPAREWLVVTPDGLFDGSPGAWGKILWRFGNDLFDLAPLEAFFNEFFHPGLLADILAGRRPRAPRDIRRLDRRPPRVSLRLAAGDTTPDTVLSTRTVSLRIELAEAAGERPGGVRDVRLFRNGSLVQAWRGELRLAGGRAAVEATIPIVAGENRLIAYAFNRDNVKSPDAALTLQGAGQLAQRGTAYLLAIGVTEYANPQYNLRYAVADARAFAEELGRRQAALNRFARVEVVPVLDRHATRANILGALARLAGHSSGPPEPGEPAGFDRLTRAQPEDAVFLYFAGHGTAAGPRFYLIPHDLGYTGPRDRLDQASLRTILEHAISDLHLEQALEPVDAGHIVLVIDACNSGQALEAEEKRRGPMNTSGLAQLAYEKGMYVLTAAQSYQAALEASRLGHGYLTYALVEEGLRTSAADRAPQDGTLSLPEWLDYAVARVPAMQRERLDEARRLRHDLVFVPGDEAVTDIGARSVQRPRVFYRRELPARPVIVARPGR